MTTLHIVAIGTGEAHALRAAAEYWRAFVTVTWVGNSGQIVEYFSKCPAHDLIIIAGHGDERGLLLPELAEEIRSQYPYNKVIRAEDFACFLHLAGNTVINTSCMGGMQQLAEVFLSHGAAYYIGPTAYPEGSASLMYSLDFLYNYILDGQHVEAAHLKASNYADDRNQFHLYRGAS
jgi:hypothetical protein